MNWILAAAAAAVFFGACLFTLGTVVLSWARKRRGKMQAVSHVLPYSLLAAAYLLYSYFFVLDGVCCGFPEASICQSPVLSACETTNNYRVLFLPQASYLLVVLSVSQYLLFFIRVIVLVRYDATTTAASAKTFAMVVDREARRMIFTMVILLALPVLGFVPADYFAIHGGFAESVPGFVDAVFASSAAVVAVIAFYLGNSLRTFPTTSAAVKGKFSAQLQVACTTSVLFGLVFSLKAISYIIFSSFFFASKLGNSHSLVLQVALVVFGVIVPSLGVLVVASTFRVKNSKKPKGTASDGEQSKAIGQGPRTSTYGAVDSRPAVVVHSVVGGPPASGGSSLIMSSTALQLAASSASNSSRSLSPSIASTTSRYLGPHRTSITQSLDGTDHPLTMAANTAESDSSYARLDV